MRDLCLIKEPGKTLLFILPKFLSGNAVLVSSAMDMSERLFLQEFLERIRQIFGGPKPVPISGSTQFNSNYDYDNNNGVDPFANDAQQEEQQQTPFNLFESNGMLKNLLFDDNTKGFIPIKQNDMNYKVLLERNYTSYNNYPIGTPQDAINGIRVRRNFTGKNNHNNGII